MNKIRFLGAALGAALAVFGSPSAQAQAFPAKAVRIVVPYAPGGQTDQLARLVGAEMQKLSGREMVIENKPGASGVLAVESVVKAGADGYTLCFCTPTNVFMPAILDPNTQYDPVKVLAPVIQLFDAASLIAARPGFKAANLRDALALAKASPKGVSFGSIGTGTRAPYPVELLVSMTGVQFNQVSYKGEQPVMTDLMGDRVDLGYVSVPSALPQIKAGKLVAIAAIAPSRLASLPDLATVAETVPGYEAPVFFGLFAPAGTPRPVIERINEMGAAVVAIPAVQERLKAESLFPVAGKPDAFTARIRADAEKWNRLMK